MKSTVLYGLLACMMGACPIQSTALTPLTADRGEIVTLKAPGGHTNYQWQVSYDRKNFVDVPKGNLQNLSLKVFGPNYYRVKTVTNGDKETYLDTIQVSMKSVNFNKDFSETGGGHGYVETLDGRIGGSGIGLPESADKPLTNWKNGNARVAYYIHNPQDTVDTEMYIKAKAHQQLAFRLSVWDPQNLSEPLAENIIAFKATGSEQPIKCMGLVLPRSDYFRYQLECLHGWEYINEISKYHIYSSSKEKSYKANGLCSPSVHLAYYSTEPEGFRKPYYDWCYHEVMMPKNADIPGTYIMSMGVLEGYMGIQMNGYKKDGTPLHDVIFSMWDSGNTETDPNLPSNLRANVLDYGEGVVPSRFGGEGTGMKSFKSGNNWDCGTYVQFITNCRPETTTWTEIKNGRKITHRQKNTLVSTWYNAQDGKGWQYMSTLRLPKKSTNFSGWYSFLEDYNPTNGQALRKGYYRNGFAHNKIKGKWYQFNRTTFTHTDGGNKIGARNDYGQGASDMEPGAFFMQSGAFLPTTLKSTEVPLIKNREVVDTINLKALEARVDLAVKREAERVEAEESFKKEKLDKSKWKLLSYTTEETAGEGTNGRAAQIMDDNVDTYWHSCWTSGHAKCPYFFTIDLGDTYDVTGMQITMSGGTNRFIKSFDVYVNDSEYEAWHLAYSDKDAPNETTFRFKMPEAKRGRILRLSITGSRANDGQHVRINEIEVTGKPVVTGIEGISSDNGKFNVTCGDNDLLVKMNSNVKTFNLSLYKADGGCIYSNQYGQLNAGEVVRIPMNIALHGSYVVSGEADTYKHSQQIMWNK